MDSIPQRQGRKPKLHNDLKPMREGLFVAGAVTGRTRRLVGQDRQKELITYKIQTPDAIFYIKDWDANSQYLQVGENVELPVRVSCYSSNGSMRIDYTISRSREQSF